MKPKNVNCRKTILGKYEVTYDCPGCGESLKNDLEDAGKDDQCPHCECEFVVPGTKYKDEIERRRAERIAEKEKEVARREAEKREAERRSREAEEKAKREAELAAKEERLKASFRGKSSEEKTPIQYISEGMAELVRALFYSFLSGFFGMIAAFVGGIAASQPPENAGIPAGIAVISGIISFVYGIALFGIFPAAISSFEKGSKA